MSLSNKTTNDIHGHGHNHNHDHDHENENNEVVQETSTQRPTPSSDLFDPVRNYKGDRFEAVVDTKRKDFYRSLIDRSFIVEHSDFISLDGSRFEFSFVPAQDDHPCDLNLLITHPKRSPIQFTVFDESQLKFLSEKCFVIKSYIKLNDNKVHSKYYAMTISVIENKTVIENQPEYQYVFSFSFSNLEDDDKKIRVYLNHKQPATAGVGRE